MEGAQSLPASSPKPSIPLAILAIALVALNLWLWVRSSDAAYLVTAASFALLTPGVYLSPIRLRESFTANAGATLATKQPSWVAGATIAGWTLLLASLALRWLG